MQWILICISLYFTIIHCEELKKVAIIGSGISGLNLARLLLKHKEFQVDLFESNSKIGGRIQSTEYNNTTLNLGGLLYLDSQQLISNLIKHYMLESKVFVGGVGNLNPVGFFKDNTIEFELTNYDFLNVAKLVWRYGLSPIKVKFQLNNFDAKLNSIYSILERKTAFRDIEEFINLLGLNNMVNRTVTQYIKEMDLNELYAKEIINGTISSLFNIHDNVNLLSAFIGLAKLGKTYHTTVTGNQQILLEILNECTRSKNFNSFLNSTITSINKEDEKYTITTPQGEKEYDIVIIAAPLSVTGIKFSGALAKLNKFTSSPKANPFHVTYIEGELNNEAFHTTSFPRILIPKEKPTSGEINAIFNFGKIFRLHSMSQVDQVELEKTNLFKKGFKIIKMHHWSYACSTFEPIVNFNDIPGYVLDNDLFYTNAHEVITTGMDFALIASQNIANILEDKYVMKINIKEDI
jgi:hypothetical protein